MPKPTAQENIAKCPAQCFGILPSSREVIVIKAGETGYYPLKKQPPGYPNTGAYDPKQDSFVNGLNAEDGVSAGQRAAMEHGSLFGWECKGADPDHWNPDGTFRR